MGDLCDFARTFAWQQIFTSMLVLWPFLRVPPTEYPRAVLMQHAEALEAVRNAVRNTFVQLGAADGFQLNEHILLRSDAYCGRRFLAEGMRAIWFVEENQVKIYAKDGTVVQVLTVEEASQGFAAEDRKAA